MTASRHLTRRLVRPPNTGPVTRLFSPADLGMTLKPFVFLDLFEVKPSDIGNYPLHPHSGIATVTVVAEGEFTFSGPAAGKGRLDYGGVEWMRAGAGVWHGQELRGTHSTLTRGFQLWIALPPELELSMPEAQYLQARKIPEVGPARVVLGAYLGAVSPVRCPDGMNYLLVTLRPGEWWTYTPPRDHSVLWLAVASGAILSVNSEDGPTGVGEVAIYDDGEGPISLQAIGLEDAVFVVGSSLRHGHDLVLGTFSVHTSAEALDAGEKRLASLRI